MKKIISILVFAFIATTIFAQNELKEMHVVYSLENIKMKDPSKAMAEKSMKGMEMSMFYADGKQKVGMEMMMGLIKMQMFFDPKEKTCNMFMNAMGQKMEMTDMDSTYKYSLDHKKELSEKVKPMSPPKATGNKKEILKYKCEEYVMTGTDKIKTMKYFVTNEIKVDKSIWEGSKNSNIGMMPDGTDLPGFPLEMTMEMDEMTMTMKATSFETKVDKKEFIKPEGYTKTTSKAMKGMGF